MINEVILHSGIQSGPVVIFNATEGAEEDMLVISPFSQFMATSLTQTNNTLDYGVMGSIISIPANYNYSMIVHYSSKGIKQCEKRTIELLNIV
jgi:plasmid replication initiation protein